LNLLFFHPELLASFCHLGYDVVDMVLADQDSWDRFEAAKWLTMRRWLDANPEDEFAHEVRAQLDSEPTRYAAYTREYLGWGVRSCLGDMLPHPTDRSFLAMCTN
jgi:hypothetical protein